MYDEFLGPLQAAMEATLSDVNTMVPARIVSYDAARNRAVVQPVLPKSLADGRELPAPQVFEVPLVWTTAGGATITMPVRAGDGVMLVFAQRSLEGWLSGNEAAPQDPRRFDLSDAVAIPGLAPSRAPVDPDNLVLSLGNASITITPGGEVIIKATRIVHDAPLTESPSGDFRAASINLRTHRHGNVQGGSGTSGGPTP